MKQIFDILLSAQTASQHALDQVNRQYIILGVVANNQDPERERRITVADPSCPALQTTWLRRLQLYPNIDPPLPAIGDTVLVLFPDGDPLNGWYLHCVNATNPPSDKKDAAKDFFERIPGIRESYTGANRKDVVSKNYTIQVGTTMRFQNDRGAYLELNEAGWIELGDAFGHTMRLGAGSSNNLLEWDLKGSAIRFKNTTDFQVSTTASGFKTVTTIGSTDTRGDDLIDSGWQ